MTWRQIDLRRIRAPDRRAQIDAEAKNGLNAAQTRCRWDTVGHRCAVDFPWRRKESGLGQTKK
jgi:hypothetical protein